MLPTTLSILLALITGMDHIGVVQSHPAMDGKNDKKTIFRTIVLGFYYECGIWVDARRQRIWIGIFMGNVPDFESP